jgi:hypothetical protein
MTFEYSHRAEPVLEAIVETPAVGYRLPGGTHRFFWPSFGLAATVGITSELLIVRKPLYSIFEPTETFAQSFTKLGKLLPAEERESNDGDHHQMCRCKQFTHNFSS